MTETQVTEIQVTEGTTEQEIREAQEKAVHQLLTKGLTEAQLEVRQNLVRRGEIKLPFPLPEPEQAKELKKLRDREMRRIKDEEFRRDRQIETKQKLSEIPGLDPSSLENWDRLVIPVSTLESMEHPTTQELEEWQKLPKNFDTLQRIKYPLLCKWTMDEVVEAMAPYIGKLVSDYHTERTERTDCDSLGVGGVLAALRRDAGKAFFASHAYLSIRTSIRRESARSDVVRDSEKRPSKTDVKRAVTTWLSGTFYQSELDRLAGGEVNAFIRKVSGRRVGVKSFEDYADIGRTLKLMQRIAMTKPDLTAEIKEAAELHTQVKGMKRRQIETTIHPDGVKTRERKFPRDEKVSQYINRINLRLFGGIPVNYRDFTDLYESLQMAKRCKQAVVGKIGLKDEIAECKSLLAELPEAAKASVERQKKLVAINETNLLGSSDLEEVYVQLLGKSGAKMSLVRDSFRLDRLTLNQRLDLFDFLDQALNPDKARHILPTLNSERYRTVADLVMAVAEAPNFHSKVQSLSVPLDFGESNAREETISNDRRMGRGAAMSQTNSSPFLDPKSRFENLSEQDSARDAVAAVRQKMVLTPEQEVVMIENWGLDGVEAKNGSEIAKNWGRLLLSHAIRRLVKTAINNGVLTVSEIDGDYSAERVQRVLLEVRKEAKLAAAKGVKTDAFAMRVTAINKLVAEIGEAVGDADPNSQISRQRVTQYEDAIKKKYREALFEMYFGTVENPRKRALEQARAAAKVECARGFREENEAALRGVEAEIEKVDQQLGSLKGPKEVVERREKSLLADKQHLQARKRGLELRNVPEALTEEEEDVLCLLYGLRDTKSASIDRIAEEFECIRPSAGVLSVPSRRDLLKEIIASFKKKLLQVHL